MPLDSGGILRGGPLLGSAICSQVVVSKVELDSSLLTRGQVTMFISLHLIERDGQAVYPLPTLESS